MSFKNAFDRYCCESDTIVACAQVLQQKRFDNDPIKVVMAHDTLNAAIERLQKTCLHMGITIEGMNAKYGLDYLKRKQLRSAYVRLKREQDNVRIRDIAMFTAKQKAQRAKSLQAIV